MNLSAWTKQPQQIALPIVDTKKVDPKNALNTVLSQLLAVAYTSSVTGVDSTTVTSIGNMLAQHVYPAIARGAAVAAGLGATNALLVEELSAYFWALNMLSIRDRGTLQMLMQVNEPQQTQSGRQQQRQVAESAYERAKRIVDQSNEQVLRDAFAATDKLAVSLYGLQTFEGSSGEAKLAAFARAINPLLFENIAHSALAKNATGNDADAKHMVNVLNNANMIADIIANQSSGSDKITAQKVATVEDSFITPPPEEEAEVPQVPKTAKDYEELGVVRGRAVQAPSVERPQERGGATQTRGGQQGDGRGAVTQTRGGQQQQPPFQDDRGRSTQPSFQDDRGRSTQPSFQDDRGRSTQPSFQDDRGRGSATTTTTGGARGGATTTTTTTTGGTRGGATTTTTGGTRGGATATTTPTGTTRGTQATQGGRGGGRTSLF